MAALTRRGSARYTACRAGKEVKRARMAKPAKATYVDAQLYAMVQAIQKRVSKDPGWRVVARARDWLCPYCGQVGFSGFDPHRAPRDILKHLVTRCPDWGEDVGTRFSTRQLEAHARKIETEELLRTSHGWRMSDATGHWYCPYCAQATAIVWRSDSKEDSPSPQEVHAHLEKCPGNRDGRKPYPPEVLDIVIQDADKARDYTVAVRCKFEQDPAWRQRSQDGKWVCPKCRQAVPEVEVSADIHSVALAPGRIARHLMERCKPRKTTAAKAPAAAPQAAPIAGDGQPPGAGPRVRADSEMLVLESTAMFQVVPPAGPQGAPAKPAPAPAQPPPDAENERAREMVAKLLPGEPPQLEGYDIYCLYRPAREAGGSFYDYFYLSPEDVSLLICALPGRGMEAAATIATVSRAVRRYAQHHRSPAEVLKRVNEDVAAEFQSRSIVTALYGVLNERNGVLAYARAGHNTPLLFNRQDDPPVRELASRGVALGLQRGAAFDQALEEAAIRFRPGDSLVLHAGGVAEAVSPSGEAYGVARLAAALAAAPADPSGRALAASIADDLHRFMGDAPQKDDITLLCLRCARVGG
ncbi:MAG: serine/threonine-protein phosphatase [Planctomycetes bacterium]|nr:serine/threonine-protein phosphatase [Planctomycetota bacterium]